MIALRLSWTAKLRLALQRCAAMVCIVAATVVCRAESPDKLPKPTSYVADFAGVVDTTSRQNIEDLCRQVYTKAHATIEVVTINSLDGDSIEDFTTRLEDNWKVGPKSSDKGVLLVFAIQDHKRRIEVGYGLEGILNDAKVGDIGRDMVPQLQAGQYGAAMQTGVQELANVIATDAGVTIDAPQPQHTYHRERARSSGGGFPWIWIAVVLFFLLFAGRGGRSGMFWFLLGNLLGSGRGSGRWDNDDRGGGFGGGGGGGGNGGDFGGGFGGSSGGGGSSGDW